MSGGTITRCQKCGRLIINGQTCGCDLPPRIHQLANLIGGEVIEPDHIAAGGRLIRCNLRGQVVFADEPHSEPLGLSSEPEKCAARFRAATSGAVA